MKNETTTQRKRRLAKQRQKRIEKNSALSSDELIERKLKRRLYMRNYRASKSDRAARLERMRRYNDELRVSLSEQERAPGLEHIHHMESRELHSTSKTFMQNIERSSDLEELLTGNEPAFPEPQIKGECFTSPLTAIFSKSLSMDTPHDYVSVKMEPVEEPELAPEVPRAAHVCVKQEPESNELADVIKEEGRDVAVGVKAVAVSEAAMLAGLYADHVVKDELVLGPEVPIRPHVTSPHDACAGQLALKDCTVRLERCDAPRGATTRDPATVSPAPTHDTAPQTTADLNAANTYVCDICGKLFKRKYDIIRHVNRHLRENSIIMSNKSNIYKRVRASVKSYACDMCSKEFSKLGYLRRHQRDHPAPNTYVCDICGKLIKRKDHLIRHVNRHLRENSEVLSNKSNIYERVRTSVKYSCEICNKEFSRLDNLQRHQRVHTGDKPYSCEICQKKFAEFGNLKEHKRIHTGEKPYSCDVCKKQFTILRTMTKHKRTHTGEKSYSCDICNKAFGLFTSLKRHKLIHTGARPYTCEICEEGFMRVDTLKIHLKSHISGKSKTEQKKPRRKGQRSTP